MVAGPGAACDSLRLADAGAWIDASLLPPPPGLGPPRHSSCAAFGVAEQQEEANTSQAEPEVSEEAESIADIEFVRDVRKVATQEAEDRFAVHAADMWQAMEQKLKDLDAQEAEKVAAMEEQVRTYKEHNQRLEEQQQALSAEVERLTQLSSALGSCFGSWDGASAPWMVSPATSAGTGLGYPSVPAFPLTPAGVPDIFGMAPAPWAHPPPSPALSAGVPTSPRGSSELMPISLSEAICPTSPQPARTGGTDPMKAFCPTSPQPARMSGTDPMKVHLESSPAFQSPVLGPKKALDSHFFAPPESPDLAAKGRLLGQTPPMSPEPTKGFNPYCNRTPQGARSVPAEMLRAAQLQCSPGSRLLGTPTRPRTPQLGSRRAPWSLLGSPATSKWPATPKSPFVILEDGGSTFNFMIRKADGVELGLDVEPDCNRKALVVRDVHVGGAVEAWNKQCVGGPAAGKAVCAGDRIVNVNSFTDADQMLKECRERQLLRIVVMRGGESAVPDFELTPAAEED